jgi:alkylation response protein AidB-like acyl-CoA dehydrogenase
VTPPNTSSVTSIASEACFKAFIARELRLHPSREQPEIGAGMPRARPWAAMIDFGLDPELELLRETARRFAEQRLRPHDRDFEAARDVDTATRGAFAEIGLAAIEWPESLGGAGLGAVARALVLEELGADDAGAAIALDPLGPAFYALAECGGEAALQAIAVPLLDRPGARAVLAWNGAGQVVFANGAATGVIPWVPAERVDLLVLLDRDAVAVIDTGIATTPLRGAGLRAAGAAELRLDRAPVLEWWVDPRGASRALARARLHTASLGVGVMRAAYTFSRDYALERVAFGKPIAHHQALAFLIADMAMAVEGCRLLVHEAAARLDRGDDAAEACASAFLEVAEQSLFVTPNAVQILGGHGFMQDYPVEKWMREARTLGLLYGGADAARDDAGTTVVTEAESLALAGAGA